MQWGCAFGDEVDVTLHISYAKTYFISLSVDAHSSRDEWSRTGTWQGKSLKGFHISVCVSNSDIQSDWITIGI